MNDLFSVEGKVAVVTGGSRGVGLMIARGLVQMGRAGTLEDIAGTVIYLSSRAGAYVTGAIVPVSGGVATLA